MWRVPAGWGVCALMFMVIGCGERQSAGKPATDQYVERLNQIEQALRQGAFVNDRIRMTSEGVRRVSKTELELDSRGDERGVAIETLDVKGQAVMQMTAGRVVFRCLPGQGIEIRCFHTYVRDSRTGLIASNRSRPCG